LEAYPAEKIVKENTAAQALFAAGIGAVAFIEVIGFLTVHCIDWYYN
jgi:hypothetical protein